jgi:hypothetical protein
MSEPKSNDTPASTPDQLVSSGITAADELSDQQLEGVAGGGKLDDVIANKSKTAEKAFQAMNALIRG